MTAEQFWEILWGGEAFAYKDWETVHHGVNCVITPKRFKEALAALNSLTSTEGLAPSPVEAPRGFYKVKFETVQDPVTGETMTKAERLATPEERVINAAKQLAHVASYGAISLEHVNSELLHNLYDAVNALEQIEKEKPWLLKPKH